jgi:hypothetical protein
MLTASWDLHRLLSIREKRISRPNNIVTFLYIRNNCLGAGSMAPSTRMMLCLALLEHYLFYLSSHDLSSNATSVLNLPTDACTSLEDPKNLLIYGS